VEPTEEPMEKQMETTEASLKIGEFTKDGKKYLGITIVTFDRGFVKVGRLFQCPPDKNGDESHFYEIHNSYTIRKWGTTSGLGEIVNGPTKNTILDYDGIIDFHLLRTIFFHRCNQEKWEAFFRKQIIKNVNES